MTIHELSEIEGRTIREFVQRAADDGQLAGAVLDYGCGKQPYREIVESVGSYHPWDRVQFGGSVCGRNIGTTLTSEGVEGGWDAILSTQVIQYVHRPEDWLSDIAAMLRPGGYLILTYPGAWPVLRDHLWSFTQAGMEHLLDDAGLTVVRHEIRAALPFDGFSIPTGYGVVARA